MDQLPIEEALPEVIDLIARDGQCVLQAPPGAGKTTRVPLALLEASAFEGKLVILEPRRLAARAAAERMAAMLGEAVGQTIGYRMRGDTKIGKSTRIEVVTDGVLTRMIQSDPALEGVGAVVFDEFHERSLNGDLGLALVIEARAALRPDLKLVVMSATLDAGPVADLLGAKVATSQGRAFPVETRWLDRPLRPPQKPWQRAAAFTAAVVDLIETAMKAEQGSALVFLPGEREIRDVATRLKLDAEIRPLYGQLPIAQQRAAIAPATTRKIVLATSIAETSLTIEGVRIVIDAGKARRARFDPRSGMSRLVTEPISRAEADQRRGRAGRTAPGICYRMWTKPEEGALPAFPPAEIEAADLARLALELAAWGATRDELQFLTPPPDGAFAEAVGLLQLLGALDAGGRVTVHGRQLAGFPLHPRLAHMMVRAGSGAAGLAAILSGRDPVRGGDSDLGRRLRAIDADPALRKEAARVARLCDHDAGLSLAEQAALAYPDRVGLRRPGDAPRYVLSGGKGAAFREGDALSGARLIVAANLDGDAQEAMIRQAVEISEAELRGIYGDRIAWLHVCEWSRRERRVIARRREMFGALVLSDQIWADVDPASQTVALMDGLRNLGLAALDWTKPARLLSARVKAADVQDWSDTTLLDTLDEWLAPFAAGKATAQDLKTIDLAAALRAKLSWEDSQALDMQAPARFTTPLGRDVPIDYSGDVPAVAVRLQELFGLTTHPVIAGQTLQLTLLSPGQKPVQVTADLPGFWESSYQDVRRDMRGRYPKHPWPEDPTEAAPTLRAKPRK